MNKIQFKTQAVREWSLMSEVSGIMLMEKYISYEYMFAFVLSLSLID